MNIDKWFLGNRRYNVSITRDTMPAARLTWKKIHRTYLNRWRRQFVTFNIRKKQNDEQDERSRYEIGTLWCCSKPLRQLMAGPPWFRYTTLCHTGICLRMLSRFTMLEWPYILSWPSFSLINHFSSEQKYLFLSHDVACIAFLGHVHPLSRNHTREPATSHLILILPI